MKLLVLAFATTAAFGLSAQEVKDPTAPTGGAPGSAPSTAFGPDAFGYQGFDSAEPQCTVQFVDIATTGTQVVMGDDTAAAVPLPAAPFNLYGTTYTALTAATNGYLSTDPTDIGPDLSNDCPLPATLSSGGGARIYPLHDDLVSTVYFQHFPTCPRPSGWGGPEGCYVFQWDARHFGGIGNFPAQAILYTTSFGIVFQHGPGNPEAGSGSTTGLQNLDATVGLTYACDTASSVQANTAQCIYHPAFPFGSAVADLSIALTDMPDPVVAGNSLTYVATTTNTGPGPANGVSISLPLPSGTSFVSATPSAGGSCNAASPVLCTWASATAPMGTRSVTVVATVAPATTGNLTATAMTATTNVAPDPNMVNNTATATTAVSVAADISMALTDAPDPIVAGAGNLTYTATATNLGPSTATGVSFSLPIPVGTTLISSTAGAGGVCSGTTTISCTFAGATAPTTARSATIVVSVPAAQTANLSATATAMATSPDPINTNNSATAATTVNTSANLGVTLTAVPTGGLVGDTFTLTGTINNAGPSDAQAVRFSLVLPEAINYLGAVTTGATCSSTPPAQGGGTLTCTYAGATAPGVTRSFTVNVVAAGQSTAPVTLTASSPTADPVAANNTAGVNLSVFQRVPSLSLLGLMLLGLSVISIGLIGSRRAG